MSKRTLELARNTEVTSVAGRASADSSKHTALVDVALRCECEAAIYGLVHRNLMRRLMGMFRAAHSKECASAAKRGRRKIA